MKTQFREESEQIALFEWASWYPFIIKKLIAIPNGGYRNKREAARLKAAGVKAGVSDIFFAQPVLSYSGLWIELKAPKPHDAKITAEQRIWLERMVKAGYVAGIAYGWVQASQYIDDYLAPVPNEIKGNLVTATY